MDETSQHSQHGSTVTVGPCHAQTATDRFGTEGARAIRDRERVALGSTPTGIEWPVNWPGSDSDDDDDAEGARERSIYKVVPCMQGYRNNLTALSQTSNLYFAAYSSRIFVYSPRSVPKQTLPQLPNLQVRPKPSTVSTIIGGYLDPTSPHCINHLITGFLGDEEILLACFDDGDVTAYYTKEISMRVLARSNVYDVARADRRCSATSLSCASWEPPKPFLQENVGVSAWGLAIHQKSRLIAVSSNRREVTVFASALPGNKERPCDCRKCCDSVESHVRRRARNWRIVVSLGHAADNLPNICFVDDENGHAEKISAIDIKGAMWLADIWRPMQAAIRVMPSTNALLKSEEFWPASSRGWNVLALPTNSFLTVHTEEELLGMPMKDLDALAKLQAGPRPVISVAKHLRALPDNPCPSPSYRDQLARAPPLPPHIFDPDTESDEEEGDESESEEDEEEEDEDEDQPADESFDQIIGQALGNLTDAELEAVAELGHPLEEVLGLTADEVDAVDISGESAPDESDHDISDGEYTTVGGAWNAPNIAMVGESPASVVTQLDLVPANTSAVNGAGLSTAGSGNLGLNMLMEVMYGSMEGTNMSMGGHWERPPAAAPATPSTHRVQCLRTVSQTPAPALLDMAYMPHRGAVCGMPQWPRPAVELVRFLKRPIEHNENTTGYVTGLGRYAERYLMLRMYEKDVEMRPLDKPNQKGLAEFGILVPDALTMGLMPGRATPAHFRATSRLSMAVHIPELSLLVLGSAIGRVLLVTPTRLAKPVDKTGEADAGPARLHHGLRVECVLPRASDEAAYRQTKRPLHGLAVGPVQQNGMMTAGKPRRFRLMLHYRNHDLLTYEVSRQGEAGKICIF